MAQLRVYVDEDASETAVIIGLRARGVDLLATHEVEPLGTTDEEQLAYASKAGRAIYTFNASDFARLHRSFLETNRTHAGIIIIPEQRYSIGEKVRRVASFVQSATAESMRERIEFL